MQDFSRQQKHVFPVSSQLINNDLYISTWIHSIKDSTSSILIYDTLNLQLKDSISSLQTGRTNAYFKTTFSFNHKKYVLAKPNSFSRYSWSVHQIQGNTLIDSASFGLDTLLRPFVGKVDSIGPNQLRVLVYIMAPNSSIIQNTRIIDLASSFNITDYHIIDPLKINFSHQSAITNSVHVISASKWHVFNRRVAHHYNPIQKTIDSTYYHSKEILASLEVNANEYLAFGEVAGTKHFMGIPNSANTGLGFYRMRESGSIIDTTVYFARAEVQSPIFTLYAMPRLHSASFLYSDTNNIYLACSNSFSGIVGAPQEGSILVVKTNSKGAEQWRYLWSGQKLSSAVFKILPTINGGVYCSWGICISK
jgi:hypothetical protein